MWLQKALNWDANEILPELLASDVNGKEDMSNWRLPMNFTSRTPLHTTKLHTTDFLPLPGPGSDLRSSVLYKHEERQRDITDVETLYTSILEDILQIRNTQLATLFDFLLASQNTLLLQSQRIQELFLSLCRKRPLRQARHLFSTWVICHVCHYPLDNVHAVISTVSFT